LAGLLHDYQQQRPELLACFAHPPATLFSQAPARRAWDPALAAAMRAYQEGLGLARNFAGDEAVLITGQQPGLLGGPLYSVHKAMTTLLAAQRVTERTGTPCQPIFWVGADDHDFEEAREVHILSRDQEVLPLRYAPAAEVAGLPMYRVPLEASLHALIDAAAEAAPASEHTPGVRAFLHESLDAASSYADWFARIMARLFQDTPLLFFTPELPEARKLARAVLQQEIARPLESTRLLNEAGARLEALGYPPQVVKGDSECNFFLEVDGRRCKVLHRDGQFHLPEVQQRHTEDELLHALETTPERFSGNVVLRCVIQQALFPTAAYVAGPGELAYWSQLKPVFAHFNLEMPVVYPRMQCTLTTPKLEKLLTRYELRLDDLSAPPEVLRDRALRRMGDPGLRSMLDGHRRAILDAVDALRGDPAWRASQFSAARDAAARLQEQVESGLARVERAALHADEARTAAVEAQLGRLLNALAPQRKAQERVYSPFSFVFEYGWDFVPRLINRLDLDSQGMQQVEL